MNGNLAKIAAGSVLALALAGCAGMDYQERGTIIGGGVGAAAGAALTDDVGGAVAGGIIGGVIGNQIGQERDERYEYRRDDGYYYYDRY
jgi:osmotically inducible lipoprotein OsmB